MIQYSDAILLGIIQGLTEFIPVSSTAHLKIIPALLGRPDPGAAYSAVMQIGTLVSLLVYFRRDLLRFAFAAIHGLREGRPMQDANARMVYLIAAGTIPICVFGLLFAKLITGPARSLYVIAGSLIVLALLLWLADVLSRRNRDIDRLGFVDIIYIGLAQSVALVPGASRSGTTLTMGLVLGYSRAAALRISFLLSIPAVAISGAYELFKEREHLAAAGLGGLVLATVVAGIVGYMTVALLLRYLRTHSVLVFVLYRIGLGIAILVLLSKGALNP